MSRSIKKTWTTVAAGAALALTLAVAAHGATGIRTKVTLNGSEARRVTKLHGMVFTLAPLDGVGDKKACLSHRKIVLFKVTKHGAKKVKAVRTNDVGDYRLKVGKSDRKHRYFTKATRTVLADAYGNLVACQPDASSTLKI